MVLHSPVKAKPSNPPGFEPNGLPPEPGDTKKSNEEVQSVESSPEKSRVSEIPTTLSSQEKGATNPPGDKDTEMVNMADHEDHEDQEDANMPNPGTAGNPPKRGRGTNKRRHSLSGVDGQFEQLVIVVNSLSDCMEDHCNSQAEQTRTHNRKTRGSLDYLTNEIMNLKDVVLNLSQQVEDQKTTIKGLIVGEVSLTDTTGIQEKLKEVIQGELKVLKDTVEEQGDKSVKITQTSADSASQLGAEILNQVTKRQETVPQTMTDEVGGNTNMMQNAFDEAMIMSSLSTQSNQPRVNTITKNDGTKILQKVPNFQKSSSTPYLQAARNALPQGGNLQVNDHPKEVHHQGKDNVNEEVDLLTNSASNYNLPTNTVRGHHPRGHFPPGANPQGSSKYNHRQDNRGIFTEENKNTNNGPKLVRKDYPDFNEKGDLHYVEHYQEIPYTSDQQRQRRDKNHRKDQNKVDKEIVLFGIPTRDKDDKIQTKDYDNTQVVRILKELKKGGFILKDKIHIVHTIRQVRNDRHPDDIPITITLSSKEVVDEILYAAAEIGIIGKRTLKPGDQEAVKFGFIRRSLTQRERQEIKEKKKYNKTKIGQNQAKLKRREEDSRTDVDEWSTMQIEDEPELTEPMEINNSENAPAEDGGKEEEKAALEKQVEALMESNRQLKAQSAEATEKAEILQKQLRESE